MSGAEAERIGLISLAVDDADLDAKALEIATRLAEGAQSAIRWTKYALNNWLRLAGPSFDASLALEFMGFSGPEATGGPRVAQGKAAAVVPAVIVGVSAEPIVMAGLSGITSCRCAATDASRPP